MADYVEQGQYSEFRSSVLQRLMALDNDMAQLTGAEQVHENLRNRIKALEDEGRAEQQETTGRRDRVWVVVLAVMSGVISPLLVTMIIAVLHLHTTSVEVHTGPENHPSGAAHGLLLSSSRR